MNEIVKQIFKKYRKTGIFRVRKVNFLHFIVKQVLFRRWIRSSSAMELFLRLYGFLNKLVNFLITPLLIFIFGRRRNSLPKIENPVLEICAVDLAEKIRNREVSENRKKSFEATSFWAAQRFESNLIRTNWYFVELWVFSNWQLF